MDGKRQLFISELPGVPPPSRASGARLQAGRLAGNSARHPQRGGRSRLAVRQAREAYERAVAELIGQLREKDFELLVDLILSRDGWARIGPLAGSMADIDTEVENRSSNEVAFVQVKSKADQGVLNDYIERFQAQQDRFARMIFAVHKPQGTLTNPSTSAGASVAPRPLSPIWWSGLGWAFGLKNGSDFNGGDRYRSIRKVMRRHGVAPAEEKQFRLRHRSPRNPISTSIGRAMVGCGWR